MRHNPVQPYTPRFISDSLAVLGFELTTFRSLYHVDVTIRIESMLMFYSQRKWLADGRRHGLHNRYVLVFLFVCVCMYVVLFVYIFRSLCSFSANILFYMFIFFLFSPRTHSDGRNLWNQDPQRQMDRHLNGWQKVLFSPPYYYYCHILLLMSLNVQLWEGFLLICLKPTRTQKSDMTIWRNFGLMYAPITTYDNTHCVTLYCDVAWTAVSNGWLDMSWRKWW